MTTRLPARCLAVDITAIDVAGLRPNDDTIGPGLPNSWNVSLLVQPQFQSSPATPTQLVYDARDITVGDYLAVGRPVRLYRVTAVSSATPATLNAVIEDIDSITALHDQGQGGNAAPLSDAGIVFTAENGSPLLFPLPNPLPSDLDLGGLAEIISQFQFINQDAYESIFQLGNGFKTGDNIALKADGTYVKAYADANPMDLAVIGTVIDTNFPRTGFFRYRAVGPIVKYETTVGYPGNKLYLDPANPGDVATAQQVSTGRRYPVMIKLDNGRAVWIGKGQAEGGIVSFVVADNTELNTKTEAVDGDFAFVENVGDPNGEGEWGLYFKARGQWKLVALEDSVTVDARTIKVIVDFNGPAEIAAHRLGADSRIVNVVVKVTQAWDDPEATVTLGDDLVHDRFIPGDFSDLTIVDEYQSMPSYKYPGLNESVVKVFVNKANCTQGSAQVIFTYV